MMALILLGVGWLRGKRADRPLIIDIAVMVNGR